MQQFLGFLNGKRGYLVFAAALILSLNMIVLRDSARARVAGRAASFVLKAGQWLFSWAINTSEVRHKNLFLREQNVELSMEIMRLKEAGFENLRLRRLLEFKDRSPFSYIPADVIGRDLGRLPNTIWIDVGLEDNVRERMPVVTPEGLVGKILDVFPSTARVQLLLDRNCRVSAVIQRARRLAGIVEWKEGEMFRLKYIPLRSDVEVGDTVVSSGMGGVFPKGLQIGEVSWVSEEPGDLFREVTLRPSVDFSRLEEVFVVKTNWPKPPEMVEESVVERQ